MGGQDQVPVVPPGESLRLALTAPVDPQLVEQVRPVPGPVARHPGDADPAAARAPHLHDGPGAARRPGAALRRPQPLACLVLEADEGAQVARRAFISAHTSAFHTATASSSRSIARRTGTWQDQPCRRISLLVPSMVYPTWNRRPISVLIRPSVHRSAASSRSRSRRCCSAGVYPPRCAYLISRSYARDRPASRPELYEFSLCI